MAEYRKQIAYLDYLEDGVKIKNAGFVRIEEQNGHNRMEVKVKNLPGKDCGEFRLQEEHERTVGRISLQGGNGNCCMVWRMPEPGEQPGGKLAADCAASDFTVRKKNADCKLARTGRNSGTERDATAAATAIAGTRGSVPTDGGAVIADKFTPAARSWRNYSVSGAARQRDGKAVHTEGTCRNRAVRHIGGACRNRAVRHVKGACGNRAIRYGEGARGNEAAAHSGSAICVSVRADDPFSFRSAEIAVLSIA